MLYTNADGTSATYGVDAEGQFTRRSSAEWLDSFDLVVPADLDGNDTQDVVLYDADGGADGAGRGALFGRTPEGGLLPVAGSRTWSSDWDHIVAGEWSGDGTDEILFHDADTASMEIRRVEGTELTTVTAFTTWRGDWDVLVPFDLNGDVYTDLLLYDADGGADDRGMGQIYQGRENGLSSVAIFDSWLGGWDQIVPGNYSDEAGSELLFYDADAGVGAIHAVGTDGALERKLRRTGWWQGWDTIVPFDLDGDPYTDLVFYDATGDALGGGAARIYQSTGEADLIATRDVGGWRTDWDTIFSSTRSAASVPLGADSTRPETPTSVAPETPATTEAPDSPTSTDAPATPATTEAPDSPTSTVDSESASTTEAPETTEVPDSPASTEDSESATSTSSEPAATTEAATITRSVPAPGVTAPGEADAEIS